MINWIRQYLLSVTAAAIVCAVIKVIIDKKANNSTVIRLLIGIFLTVTVISPFTKLDFIDITNYIQGFSTEADAAAASGVLYAQEETARIIKSQTEAYILDKAASLGLVLQVEVTVSENTPPTPYAVTVQAAAAAPYARERLKQYIADDLGIPEAQQTWI